MEIFAGLSVVLLILVALFIAIKTFALWGRTRGRPELLLGTMLMSATVIGYPLAIAMKQIPAADNPWVSVAAQAMLGTGFCCLMLFTLTVFRPSSLWARCLVGVVVVGFAATTVLYAHEAFSEHPRALNGMPSLMLLTTIPPAIAYFWNTLESLSYFRQLKLRLRLGLTDVVVANRVLLWGLMTLSAGLALVISMAVMLAGAFLPPPVVVVCSFLGVIQSGCLFFAFCPPAWYKAWLRRSPVAEVH